VEVLARGPVGAPVRMEKILVAVGSTRRPKLDAVDRALSAIFPLLHPKASFEIAAVAVPSGVRHTPLSREEMMAGARERVNALRQVAEANNEPWKYFVGLEGGIDTMREGGRRLVFLQNWAYVADGTGAGAFGQSGALLLPEFLAKQVVDDGVELAEAIDLFAGSKGIRDAQGAWGVLTRNLITREEAFRIAIVNAFAPRLGPPQGT
jgi:inosine/xanthosine triphosphatase